MSDLIFQETTYPIWTLLLTFTIGLADNALASTHAQLDELHNLSLETCLKMRRQKLRSYDLHTVDSKPEPQLWLSCQNSSGHTLRGMKRTDHLRICRLP